MNKRLVFVFLAMLPLLGIAGGDDRVVLLGNSANIAFDEVKAIYFANTVNALLKSCTTATVVRAIPAVSYKGVRVIQASGRIVDAHIFPDSTETYMVKLYTTVNGVTKLHGKYSDHAYQLISMLELQP